MSSFVALVGYDGRRIDFPYHFNGLVDKFVCSDTFVNVLFDRVGDVECAVGGYTFIFFFCVWAYL